MSCFAAWMGGKIFSCIMKKVTAIALASGFDFAHATEIGRIEFQPHSGLSIVVRDVYGQCVSVFSLEAPAVKSAFDHEQR